MQTKTDLIPSLQIYPSCVVVIIDQVMVTAEGKDPMAKKHLSICTTVEIGSVCHSNQRHCVPFSSGTAGIAYS